MSIKKSIAIAAAIVSSASIMSVSASASTLTQIREEIKEALFEYIYANERCDLEDEFENTVKIEQNPYTSYLYSSITQFIDYCDDEYISNIDPTDWDNIDKVYENEWTDWYDETDGMKNEWEIFYDTNNRNYYIQDMNGSRFTFENSGDHWKLVDERGNLVGNYDKLYQFSYLNEEPENPENNDSEYEEDESSEEAREEFTESRASASTRVTGIPTDEPVRAYPVPERENALNSRVAETTGRVKAAERIEDDDEEDEEDTGAGALSIIGSAVAGIAIGATGVTLMNIHSSKKKK